MHDLGSGHGLQNIVVRPVYLRAVNAIVQPEQQVPCTLYFFREWLPRLGSLRWSLVLALRHLCTNRQSDGTGRGEVTRAQLAALLGVHEVTISRLLTTKRADDQPGWRVLQPTKEEDTETAFLARFVPRLRYKYERDQASGTTRRIGYIIDVVMDDPLTPEDEQRLAVVLAQQILAGSDCQSAIPQQAAAVLSSDPGTQDVTYQNAISGSSVKQHNATTCQFTASQFDTSHADVNRHIASSDVVKAHSEPGLTLTNNYNYHEITIPLTLSRKPAIRKALEPLVSHAATALRDSHSTGMFYSTLTQLYPNHLDLFVQALEEALQTGAENANLNLGAVFVNNLKALAHEHGLALKLGKKSPTKPQPASPPSEQVDEEVAEAETLEANTPLCAETAAPIERESVFLAEVGMTNLQIWQSTLQLLRLHTSKANHEMWLKNCRIVGIEDGALIIGAPNRFARDKVRQSLLPAVGKAVAGVIGRSLEVRCEIAHERQSSAPAPGA